MIFQLQTVSTTDTISTASIRTTNRVTTITQTSLDIFADSRTKWVAKRGTIATFQAVATWQAPLHAAGGLNTQADVTVAFLNRWWRGRAGDAFQVATVVSAVHLDDAA